MDGSPMLAAAAGFALLLGVAAWRKVRDIGAFEAILADYRLLPELLMRPAAIATPAVEGALAAAWVVAPWQPDGALVAGVGTAVLMLGYGLAMTTNLARGRSWIDCGCGGGEELSWVLVGRNLVLAAAGARSPGHRRRRTHSALGRSRRRRCRSWPSVRASTSRRARLLANVAAMRVWTEE